MLHQTKHIILDHPDNFKRQVLKWADEYYDTVCFFDNNHYRAYSYNTYEGLIGIGSRSVLKLNAGKGFDSLKDFYERKKDWLFGFFGYDLKNEIENLSSNNYDGLNFPELFFFQPEIVIEIFDKYAIVHAHGDLPLHAMVENGKDWGQFIIAQPVQLCSRISKRQYLETIHKIHQHISRGDLYEMNFCQEFFAEKARISPLGTFMQLNEISQAPFSCYLKFEGKYLLSASPERFLRKQQGRLISMPIKGTARRGKNQEEDNSIRQKLFHDAKERSENVMIVDLVRNDLSRSCREGTVKVEELFGIKTFPYVHQMVSTITGVLRDDVHFIDAIRYAFPMGSMTGAPKIRAMELIEQYEHSKRGLYAGAAGYITPEGDFDFNVVIRSLLYNSINQYLSFQVGGAIVFDSVPEKEYEECLLKAKTLVDVLQPQTTLSHSATTR